VRCFVVAGFLLTSASRGPSAIAEPLVKMTAVHHLGFLKICFLLSSVKDSISMQNFVEIDRTVAEI